MEVFILYKLLIADDEFEIRNGLSSYFPWEEIGFEIVGIVENGMEALSFINNHPVDVLLTDIRMDELSGIEVAKQLDEQKSSVVVVFLSGYKDFDYAQQAIQYGVKNYMTKPTQYREIAAVFSKVKAQLDEKNLLSIPPATNAHHDRVIETIFTYVNEHYQSVSLEGVSQIVHLNPVYISKYFKDKTGRNFSEYVNEVRMEKSATLLKNPDYKIYEISELIGYSNAKNFTRTFRKYFGKTPRDYRNEVYGIYIEE